MTKTVVLLGALDTKGEPYAWLRDRVAAEGLNTLLVDTSVLADPSVKPDFPASEVALAAGSNLAALRLENDRGKAVAVMARGAREIVRRLHAEGRLDGIVGLGGSGGSSVITDAMRALPIGVPKVMVSTLASGDTRPYVGGRDIMMMYPVVDIAGLNTLAVRMLNNAAGAIAGMVKAAQPMHPRRGRAVIGATQFGVTTPCVDVARALLEDNGYEVLPFHSAGTGGQSFEALIREGAIDATLDITLTELCDELLGGIHSAGPNRLEAAGAAGIPQVVSVGALDICDFAMMETVPPRYASRNLYRHNPNVTLMRTTPEECRTLGREVAAKLNRAKGPVHLFLPLRGISAVDAPGKPFHDPAADAALFDAIRKAIDPAVVQLTELDLHINDLAFAQAMATSLLALLDARATPEHQEMA